MQPPHTGFRTPAGLDDDLDEVPGRPDEVELPPSSGEPSPGPRPSSTFEHSSGKDLQVVTVPKETDTTRIGIGLRPDMPDRAVVHTIAPGTPAAGLIQPYDEILSVAGEPISSAVHAVQLIRECPAGELHIELRRAAALSSAVETVQNGMRNAMAHREGLSRRSLLKETPDAVLGLSFSPEYKVHSVIKMVKEGGLAATALQPGDLVRRLNGIDCFSPADTARMLREASGRLELLVLPARLVDGRELYEVEAAEAARQQEQEEALHAREGDRHDSRDDDDDDERYGEDGERYGEDGDESFSDEDDDDYDESERARMNEAVPPRPAYTGEEPGSPERPSGLHIGGNARRLPPSLSGLTPDGPRHRQADACEPPMPLPGVTSGTRMGGPPLAKGAKPQGWREWLQQRKGGAATVPAPNSPRRNHPAEELQRV
jgi:hypothetical protein